MSRPEDAELAFEPTPELPKDGTGIISVRTLGDVQQHLMEGVWEDTEGRKITVRGEVLSVLKWAFYMPSAETRDYGSSKYEFVNLNRDYYDALAM